jgi:hypothetical protein
MPEKHRYYTLTHTQQAQLSISGFLSRIFESRNLYENAFYLGEEDNNCWFSYEDVTKRNFRGCDNSAPRRMISWLSNSLSTVIETLDRKVAFRVIMPRPGSGKDVGGLIEMLYNYRNFTLRMIPKEPKFGFSIWDGKEILMTTSVDSSTPVATLWSNNRGLVDLCQKHFCCLWKKAEKA